MEKTECGNTIKRGFSMAGSNGSEYAVMEKYLDKGYQELYYSAPYYWAVVNLEERKIFTYTEGDTALIECESKDALIKEINGYIAFLEESEQAKTNEAKDILRKVG